MPIVDVTDAENALMQNALRQHAFGLRGYVHWTDDRPTLPARQVAIDRIKQEATEAVSLAYKLLLAGGKS